MPIMSDDRITWTLKPAMNDCSMTNEPQNLNFKLSITQNSRLVFFANRRVYKPEWLFKVSIGPQRCRGCNAWPVRKDHRMTFGIVSWRWMTRDYLRRTMTTYAICAGVSCSNTKYCIQKVNLEVTLCRKVEKMSKVWDLRPIRRQRHVSCSDPQNLHTTLPHTFQVSPFVAHPQDVTIPWEANKCLLYPQWSIFHEGVQSNLRPGCIEWFYPHYQKTSFGTSFC